MTDTTWPAFHPHEWKETQATLHQWLQVVGKLRVAHAPWTNHQWHVPLHLTTRGLTTRPIPCEGGTFQVDLDFLDHGLALTRSDGRTAGFALEPRTVSDFHRRLIDELGSLEIDARIHGTPNEIPDAIPFARNTHDRSYDPESVERFFRVLASAARVLEDFRGGFIGKCSPVHFFWGGMDLAVTRFSGRRAPLHPGGIPNLPDWITREAYSHEVSSAGFWPGGEDHPALFYSYAYPGPDGFEEADVRAEGARWDSDLGEFVLPYDRVREAADPERVLMDFLESTYEAAAELGDWDRNALEWTDPARPPVGGRSS